MNTSTCRQKPPTPPLHRCPSWESRIYSLAQTSLAIATSSASTAAIRANRDALSQPLHLLLTSGTSGFPLHATIDSQTLPATVASATDAIAEFLPEGPTPVYTCYNGFASVSRSIPLSDLSSDDDSDREHLACSPEKKAQSKPIRSDYGCDYDVPPDAFSKMTLNGRTGDLSSQSPDDAIRLSGKSFRSTGPASSSKSPLPVGMFRSRKSSGNRDSVLSQAKFADEPQQQESKSGFLLCCKQKSWKQRYFVLKDGQLWYFRSQSDAVKLAKPSGRIELNGSTQITRTANSNSIRILHSGGKCISLTAESMLTIEEWVAVSALHRPTIRTLFRVLPATTDLDLFFELSSRSS
jgi:hypothetical protein